MFYLPDKMTFYLGLQTNISEKQLITIDIIVRQNFAYIVI